MTRLRLRARPTLDDVDRLARGLRAKRRGTGSRAVAHRLNRDEMRVFERAKRDGFAAVRSARDRRGTGSPLLNTLRQRADALAQLGHLRLKRSLAIGTGCGVRTLLGAQRGGE